MYKFTASVKNDLRSQLGTNLAVKGFSVKAILKPQDTAALEMEQADKTLTFILIPSSGGTAERTAKVEVKNGTETTTASPNEWEVKVTASGDAVEITASITHAQE